MAYIFNILSLYKHLLAFQLKMPTIPPKIIFFSVIRMLFVIHMIFQNMHGQSVVDGTWIHSLFEIQYKDWKSDSYFSNYLSSWVEEL